MKAGNAQTVEAITMPATASLDQTNHATRFGVHISEYRGNFCNRGRRLTA
jgi:hypothetical protein